MDRIKEEIENPVSSTESTVLNINEELMEELIKEEEPIKSNHIIKPLAELFLEFINTKNDFNIVLSKTTIDTLCKIINLKPTFLNDIEEILLEALINIDTINIDNIRLNMSGTDIELENLG